MRENKFRGIPIGKDTFVYGGLVRANERRGNCLAIKDTVYNINNGKVNLIPYVVQPETVGQYIGLNDSENKQVYQGDVILFDNTDIGGGITRGEVIWNKDLTLFGLGWHLWVIETNILDCHAGFMGMDWLGKITIVGNIHTDKS